MSGLAFFLAVVAPTPGLAQSPPTAQLDQPVASVVSKVQDKYATVQVMRADFVQVSRSSLYGDEEQRGSLVLQRPRKMRWKFQGTGKQFVTDGDTMWIYSPQDKQVLRFRDFSAQVSTADQLLQSLHKVGDLFDIQMIDSEPAQGFVLALTPKDDQAKAQVKAVQLQLDPKLLMRKLVITDAFDSVTELTFSNVELGGAVDEGTFRFKIPDGVEVIDSNAG